MASHIQELKVSAHTYPSQAAASSVVASLLPIMASVFVAFLVTGLANPALGLVAGGLGLSAVFLASALAVACSAAVAARLLLWSAKN